VGEMKCLGAARTFFLKIGLATNSDHGKTKKREREKHIISRNSETTPVLKKKMQIRISTEQNQGNCYGLNPG